MEIKFGGDIKKLHWLRDPPGNLAAVLVSEDSFKEEVPPLSRNEPPSQARAQGGRTHKTQGPGLLAGF